MVKAKDSNDGLRDVEVTFGSWGGSNTQAYMSPVDGGIRVKVRPSDKVGAEIKQRGIKSIKARWRTDANGQPKQLVVTAAKPGERSTKVRYNASGNHPHFFVKVGNVADRVTTEGSCACPEERLDGDTFSFAVPPDLRFNKGERHE
jgi:hypothetical protein